MATEIGKDSTGLAGAWRRFLVDHASRISELKYSLFLFRKNRLAVLGFVLILATVAVALSASLLATQHPFYVPVGTDVEQRWTPILSERLLPPSFAHPFGTDQFGVDWYSKVIYAAGTALQVGLLVVIPASLVGSLLGLLAGFKGGILEEVIMRITDVFLSIPGLILAIAITGVLGRSIVHVMYALIITWWPWYTRLVRGQVLSVKERQFIESAKSVGASPTRLMLRHILPNTVSPVIVQGSMDFGYVILTAAGLGFLGLGAVPGTAEWGVMIYEGINFLFTAPWMSTFPGIAIVLAVLGFNLVGDGLRDILDPRLRR
jgi:peptide/nickel transport system permease protein